MRFDLVWRRPAVSTMTASILRAVAAESASKITAEGSEPDFCLMTSTPERLAPDFELFDRGGAEGVRSDEHYAGASFFQTIRKLADGGGFSGAVDADDEQDARSCGVAVPIGGRGRECENF